MAIVKTQKTEKTQTSQTQKLVSYFTNIASARALSASQARSRFGIKNLSARISDLRKMGFEVQKSQNKVGNTTYFASKKS